MSEKINELNKIKQKLHEVNSEANRAIAMQKEIIEKLMSDYNDVARWYIDNGFNYEDTYSDNGDMILIARSRNEENAAYVWDPFSGIIEYHNINSFQESTSVNLESLLFYRYFNEIVGNIKFLDHSLKDHYDGENAIINELFTEIESYKELYNS